MQLNYDLIRDILLTVEDINFNSEININELFKELPKYSRVEIQYHCNYLDEAGLIKAVNTNDLDNAVPTVLFIRDLTPLGHQFLANIRSDTLWEKVKARLADIGVSSVPAIIEVASNVAMLAIRQGLQSP